MSLIENKSLTLAENEQFIRAVSVVSTQLNTKARLGAVAQSFNPDAVDGDGDGLVQDGSPFERPAVINTITSAAQRVGKIISKASLSKEGRAKAYHQRHSGMSARDIAKDAVPANFNEWAAQAYERLRINDPLLPQLGPDTTPDQIKEIIEKLEKYVEPDLIWLLSREDAEKYKADKAINKNKAFSELVEKSFDFSPQAVAKNRKLVEHVLTTNPQFRKLVDRYGMPPVFLVGDGIDKDNVFSGFMSDQIGMGLRNYRNPKSRGRLDFITRRMGNWFMDGLMSPDVKSNKSKRWTTRTGSPEALLIHEYGHHLADVLKLELSPLDKSERTKKWQAWRFSAGSNWKETFKEIGSPEWYEKYKIGRGDVDVPQEVPHIETGYGESTPAEAFAEAISAIFALDGVDQDLVSEGMRELVADFLSLDPKRDIREQMTPKRAAREIIPDGFASRGAVAQINKEKDARYGDLTDPYELSAELLGTLDGDDPVGKMVRRLQEIKDDPEAYEKMVKNNRRDVIDGNLNIRAANLEEALLVTSVLLNDPAFADMIRRHGISNIYFSQTDLISNGTDVRGVLSGGFVPDDSDSGQFWPPRIVIDLIGSTHERNLPDQPMSGQTREKILEYAKGRAPGNVTRTHLSRSDKHVIRHEGGHSIHDILWEKQHRGEITGRRARLIRAYSKPTWEEFYEELGRPDLWREHQRAIRVANDRTTMLDNLRGLFVDNSPTPSQEIGQVDSAYAWFNPKEMFAEAFSAYTSSNPYYRSALNDTMVDHLQSILGDADVDQVGFHGNPPPMVDKPETDIPQPPPWDGFASKGPDGTSPKSYSDFRAERLKKAGKSEQFSRSDMFRNTTTDQKVDLAVPTNQRDYKLMLWDAYFEKMGLRYEEYSKIDLSDPDNPKPPRRWGSEFTDDLLDVSRMLDTGMPDFDPATVETNRQAMRATLDAFPRMRELAERFGIPPVTTMTRNYQDRMARELVIRGLLTEVTDGRKQMSAQQVQALFDAAAVGFDAIDGLDDPRYKFLRDVIDGFEQNGTMEKLRNGIAGGYSTTHRGISMAPDGLNSFIDGTRYDHAFVPEKGDFLVGGSSYEATLLHEFAHHVDTLSKERDELLRQVGDEDALERIGGREELLDEAMRAEHIATTYGQSSATEFFAESIAAVLSGSRDQEAMLSPEANKLARSIAGIPEKDPVFAGRIPGTRPTDVEVLADRFGELWRRTTDGLMEPFDKERGLRSRDGVPDVLETMIDAKLRTGLNEFPPVEFEHNGRTFAIREVGDTFEIEINSRTVARASVTPGKDGLPEIDNVDVLPGYEGVAPDKDLHEMIVDHARKKYPSARAPRRARKTEVVSEGFASIGPEHHDMREIDGTPGTPEYVQAIAAEFEKAQAEGKKVFFNYNGVTREVTITEIFTNEKGIMYMNGLDALRNGESRQFRLDRVSMPKRVENPETNKAEILTLPGKKPRRPVPIFTGKAVELFEGAESWEDVAARLGKGRFVFFDFETTGIEENPESVDYFHPGTPVQIGLVEIIDGKVTRRWSTHVNPGRPMSIDPKTGRSWSADNLKYKDPITGDVMPLTNEWLAQQMPLDAALKEMLEFIGPMEDTILGGQNHPYDDDVMKRAMIDAGLDPAKWNPAGFIDSQALAQSLLDKDSDDYPRDPKKGYKTVSLGPLAKWLGHDMGDGWHSADADSEASYEAFKRLVDRAALQEGQGIAVRRDLFAPGGGEKELAERMKSFEREKSGFDWKVKKYKEQQAKISESPATEGFASRAAARVRDVIDKRRRAKDPARWENLTQEERNAATQASAKAAIDYLNALQDAGVDVIALRDLDRAELDAILRDLVPGGEARVSDYITGDGKSLIEVSNATMGQVFMSLGFHVQVISDDPNEQYLLENGINDMQKALQDYVSAVAKDPDALLKDRIFLDWADREGLTLGSLRNPKQLEKAAKEFAEKFEINLCLYYKAGTNMLCGANIGIQREEMPQLGGRMKGDDTLAARAIKAGLMTAKEFKIDKDKLDKLDQAKQDELKKLAKNPARVAELAKSKDPLAQELFNVLNWNDSEASVEDIADRAAAALGIIVDKPRFVDPATMLGAQNELQGSKVENMADGAVNAVLKALPILEARLGRKPTQEELMNYLSTEIPLNEGGGLFQPTLTAGLPGGQIYMLDGHHRWAGLLMANKKLEAMGLDTRVQLNIKNYQTDIRSGLELGRAMQVAMGVKDAKLAGEEKYIFDPNISELTEADFDKAITDLLDPANLINKIREVREGGKFRETEAADVPGGQAERLAPRQVPIQETIARMNLSDPKPKSRVKGVKPQQKGYRAADTGNGWTSVEDHINIETERGNELFETYEEYLDKGYEVAWVTHTPKEAGRYAISADQIDAFERDEISVDPANIDSVDLTGAELVAQDGEGGYLYARRKPTNADRKLRRIIDTEEEFLDGFASRSRERRAERMGDTFTFDPEEPLPPMDDMSPGDRLWETFQREGTMAPTKMHTLRKIQRWIDQAKKRGEYLENEEELKDYARRIFLRARGTRGKNQISYNENVEKAVTDYIRDALGFGPDNIPGEPKSEGFASTGTTERPVMLPLDLVSGVGDTTKRGGKAQRDREIVPDDFYTRRPTNIAGVRVPEFQRDEAGAPMPGAPIYRESMKIGRKTYTFEVDADGIVSVYTGRRYKMVAQMNLDRGHSQISGGPNPMRNPRKDRHHIDYIFVDKRHRRKGIATAMTEMAEHAYGGRVEHSASLTPEGKKFRDADMTRRGTPGAQNLLTWANPDEEGFASRGSSGSDRDAGRIAGRGAAKTPEQIIGEEYLNGRLDGYHRFGGNVSNTELNMLAIYRSWQESDESWDSFMERFPALQSMIQRKMSRYEQQAAAGILEDMLKERPEPRSSITTAQREGALRRMNNPRLGAGNIMTESIVDARRMEQRRQDLQLQKNYMAWKNSGDSWEKFIADNPAIEKLIERERSSGKLNERITAMLSSPEKPDADGFASSGIPDSPPDSAFEMDSPLDRVADRLKLGRGAGTDSDLPDATIGRFGTMITPKDQQTLAQRLGLTWEQITEQWERNAGEINQLVDRFIADPEVREWVKYGLKFLSVAGSFAGATRGMAELIGKLEFNPGSGEQSGVQDVFDMIVHFVDSGIGEALLAYGANYARLIAAELAAMRLVTRQKAKKMIEEIKDRIEGSGQYIGVMSNEMWARLRGAWAKVRPLSPIGAPIAAKQWIVAGSSPMWAEMSWLDYQAKSRITDDLLPTDPRRWASIALKVGQSPELIDVATYRAGIGYGRKRIKSRDVVRVYATTG